MKVFKAYFDAVNRKTKRLETYTWKPVFGETREEAQEGCPSYVVLGEEIDCEDHSKDQNILNYFKNAVVH